MVIWTASMAVCTDVVLLLQLLLATTSLADVNSQQHLQHARMNFSALFDSAG